MCTIIRVQVSANVEKSSPLYFPLSLDTYTLISDGISDKVITATSSDDVSMTLYVYGGVSSVSRSGASVRLIPVKSLGKEYFIITISSSVTDSYFQVG